MTDTIQDRLREEADDFDWPVGSDTAHAAAAHIDAQDAKIKALVDFIEDLLSGEDTDGDWRVDARAALAAAKETT